MKNTLPVKTIYYTDERNDEFSEAVIQPKKIDENWKYIRRGFWSGVKRFLAYWVIAHPLAYCYCRLKFRWTVKNKKVFKQLKGKKQGFFMYGNHTQPIGDAVIPSLSVNPKSVYTIVHANNVSMPYLGRVNAYMGALPMPANLKASRNFKEAIHTRYKEGNCIMIYPEAHIWPYYIGIRDFPTVSFRYPVDLSAPCFALTNTYQKRKHGKTPKIVTYIDGPFYPDESLPVKERMQKLRNQIYDTMVERSRLSDCEYIRYLPKEDTENKQKDEEND